MKEQTPNKGGKRGRPRRVDEDEDIEGDDQMLIDEQPVTKHKQPGKDSDEMTDDEFIKELEGEDKKKDKQAVDLEKMTRRQRMAYFAAQAKAGNDQEQQQVEQIEDHTFLELGDRKGAKQVMNEFGELVFVQKKQAAKTE